MKIRRKHLILIALPLLTALLLTVLPISDHPMATPKREATPTPTSAEQAVSEKRTQVTLRLPSPELYLTQVRDAHHGTPQVIRVFADELASHMEKAADSPEYAQALFTQLADCSTDALFGLKNVQALCGINAARLAEKQPELRVGYLKMRNSVSPEVSDLMRAMDY